MNHFQYAARHLAKSPAFTLAAVLTLALGIGANSALFRVLHAVLLDPLPYPEPDRLVQLETTIAAPGKPTSVLPVWSYPRFELARDRNPLWAGIAAVDPQTLVVGGDLRAERVEAELVSAGYFPLLGLRAIEGRVFTPDEDRKGAAHPVVVIGEGYWRRRFGGEPGVVGRTVRLNQTPMTIVGVLPASFRGQMGTAELWAPITMAPLLNGDPKRLERPFTLWHRVLARLQSSTSLAAARAALASWNDQLEQALPMSSDQETYGLGLTPLREAVTDPMMRRSLWMLAAAVGFVLLIACANLANLLLARAVAREREMALRLALGATRGHLARQWLAETLLLATCAGVVAWLFAQWTIDLMAAFQPADEVGLHADYARLPDFGAIRTGAPVLGLNFGMALVCGLCFGLWPAWRTARGPLVGALHRVTQAAPGASRGGRVAGLRNLLVVAESALALMLLLGAGLMLQSFARLTTTEIGFDPKHLLTFRLDQPTGESEESSRLFFEQVLERVRALPGVESAALANAAPLSSSFDRSFMQVRAAASDAPPREAFIGVHLVNAGYLPTFRIPLVRGRWITDQDDRGTPLVAVVSQTAARQYWPGRNPVGDTIDLSPALSTEFARVEVVGVVGDVKYDQMAAAMGAQVYLSCRQTSYPVYQISVRTAGDPVALSEPVRRCVAEVNSTVPVYDLATMDQRIAESTSRTAFNAVLLAAFAGLALALAVVGLYGVVTCSVEQRTREIGIRIALGARSSDVLRLILRQGLRLVGLGVGVGVLGAWAFARLLRSLLFEIHAIEPLAFAGVALVLGTAAVLACWRPARRASRVDPMVALRHE